MKMMEQVQWSVGQQQQQRVIVAVVLSLVIFSSLPTHEAATNRNDVNTLLSLKQQWGGLPATVWSSRKDPCVDKWYGVSCDNSTTQRVISLFLISAQLTGSIPSNIKSLTALQNLDLSFNPGLVGSIPPVLGTLSSLTTLSLQSCGLTGSIPSSLGQLTNLTYLALNNNYLTGPIPPSLGALVNILWFDLAYNNLNGSLPVSTNNPLGMGLDNMTINQHFHLSNNSFSGSIPPELGVARNCVHILLEFNQLTGPIPSSLGNLSSLQILSLHYNQLTGAIPTTLNNIIKGGSFKGLHQLRLGHNNLTGTVPSFNALGDLVYVDFSANTFDSQPFPAWLNASSKALQTLVFENGNLTGQLPQDLLSYPNLQSVFLRENSINGSLTLPANLGINLLEVSLQFNQISGINQLTNNKTLPKIELQGNPICTGAALVNANPTLCNGTVTPEATNWTSPLLSSNTCTNNCDNTHTLNPESCLCGYPLVIGIEIRSPPWTDINNTTLWDSLHDQTVNELGLQSTQVWVRQAYFTESKRARADIYFFPVSGESLDLNTQVYITEAFTGQKVHYDNLFKPSITVLILMPPAAVIKSGGLKKGVIIGIAVGAGVGLALMCLLLFFLLKFKGRADKAAASLPFASWGGGKGEKDGEAPKLKGARWFSFDEIKKITNNFHADNEIGVGGYGKVYKGIVAGTGELVAVKRAQEGSIQGAQEFKNEIELLSRVHHRNLVSLVGFCYEQGEQMLIYEFMPNGTVTEWLRGIRSNNPLDWESRLRIALGAARGLAYLHDLADPQIMHMDVKPCNILLDGKMVAKVADFGLSQTLESSENATSQVRGTMGYLDPEYFRTREFSPKSDVYSFGVILLELLTGKAPIQHGNYVVREIRTAVNKVGTEGIWEMLDPILIDTPVQDLELFLKLALICVEETGAQRPAMSEVVKQLESIMGDAPDIEKTNSLAKKLQLTTPKFLSGNTEPSSTKSARSWKSGQSSSSQNSSFKYSGVFTPGPVDPK